MAKEQRSSKWGFLIYKDSVPKNYLKILEETRVPFVLSPWHDQDIDSETGELKKAHKHGALYFDSLKSYSQVSDIIKTQLNGPARVEVVMSPTGMYNYFTHADNPEKTLYDINDIESGNGFNLEKFLLEQNSNHFIVEVINVIENHDFTEFEEFVRYATENSPMLLELIVDKTYFFSKYLDSRRHNPLKKIKKVSDVHD